MRGSAGIQPHAAALRQVVERFDRAGATSPEHARSLDRLGEMDERVLRDCIERGIVREGAPGKFYLYPPALATANSPVATRGFNWKRFALTLAFWLVLVLLPLVLLRLIDR